MMTISLWKSTGESIADDSDGPEDTDWEITNCNFDGRKKLGASECVSRGANFGLNLTVSMILLPVGVDE